jgi:hypothetical protein
MMRRITMLCVFVLLIFITIVGSIAKKENELPISSVSLRHSIKEEGIHCLDWYVENRSKSKSSVLTFKGGNVLLYEIRNHQSGKIDTNKTQGLSSVVLDKGETYHTSVELKGLEEGHYSAKFWAIAQEGTESAMIINFDVE